MQTITINEYSYDIDFQAFIDGLSTIDRGETVLVVSLDTNKIITKK